MNIIETWKTYIEYLNIHCDKNIVAYFTDKDNDVALGKHDNDMLYIKLYNEDFKNNNDVNNPFKLYKISSFPTYIVIRNNKAIS